MNLRRFNIQNRPVGEGAPCFIIAEIGLGHDGSLGAAHAFIDAVCDTGADAVKFQTHIAEAEGTARETFRVNVFPQDASRRDYWKRTAFSEEQWAGLKRHADERGVIFLSSPFSPEAVELLMRVGVPAWKIASGETNNIPMLDTIAKTGLPVLLSTGLSLMDEIDRAVELVLSRGLPLAVYQSTIRYPCPPEHLGLNMIAAYKERYGVPAGFSDHSGKAATSIAAVTLGACSVEVHVTFSRKCFGPDISSSLTVEELKEAVQGIRFLEKALASPIDKERESRDLAEARSLYTKSIVAGRELPAGTRLSEKELAFKKPGTGIPAGEAGKVLGRKVLRPLGKDDLIRWEDLDAPEA